MVSERPQDATTVLRFLVRAGPFPANHALSMDISDPAEIMRIDDSGHWVHSCIMAPLEFMDGTAMMGGSGPPVPHSYKWTAEYREVQIPYLQDCAGARILR